MAFPDAYLVLAYPGITGGSAQVDQHSRRLCKFHDGDVSYRRFSESHPSMYQFPAPYTAPLLRMQAVQDKRNGELLSFKRCSKILIFDGSN